MTASMVSAANTVTPAISAEIITLAMKEKKPLMFWGPPGIGKSDIIRQCAESLDLELRDIRASLLDPVDLRGVPSVEGGVTRWNPPCFLPTEGRGVIFLDELPQATKAVESALLQLVLDREMGEYKLPDGWMIIAAGNRTTDGTFSQKMSKALGSRFVTHLELAPDLDQWCKWAIDNAVRPEVIAFVRLRPDLLHAFESKAAGNSFPCPRVWANISNYIGKLSPAAEMPFFAGALGDGPAVEFTSFLQLYRDMPNIDAILLDPKNAAIPEQQDIRYAVTGAMARRITESNSDRVFDYVERMPKDLQVVFVRDANQLSEEFKHLPRFNTWAIKNSEIMN